MVFNETSPKVWSLFLQSHHPQLKKLCVAVYCKVGFTSSCAHGSVLIYNTYKRIGTQKDACGDKCIHSYVFLQDSFQFQQTTTNSTSVLFKLYTSLFEADTWTVINGSSSWINQSSDHHSLVPLLSQPLILPTPARRICRTLCSHAGVIESCLGRSRLLPNCAFLRAAVRWGYNRASCGLGPQQWTRHRWNPSWQGLIDAPKQRSPQLCICRLNDGHQSGSGAASIWTLLMFNLFAAW